MAFKRINRWDNIKFFLILLVVFGHCMDTFHFTEEHPVLEGLFVFIYTFHMPAFFFISGLFSKKTVNNREIHKILPFLAAYFVTVLLVFGTNILLVKNEYSVNFFGYSGIPWFMLSMFLMYLLAMALRDFHPAYVLTMFIILSLLSGFSKGNNDHLTWMRTINFFPFFYVGYLLDAKKISAFMSKVPMRILSVAVFAALLFICLKWPDDVYWFRPLLSGRNSYRVLEISQDSLPLAALYRLCLTALGFVMIFSLIGIFPERKIPLVTLYGMRTLAVYMTHGIFIRVLFGYFDIMALFEKATDNQYLLALMLFGTAAAITLLCSNTLFNTFAHLIFYTGYKKNRTGNHEVK